MATTGGRDPLQIPAQFWQRDDVALTLSLRDIGGLFKLLRQHCGASQTRVGAAVGMTQSTVSLVMNGDQAVTAMAVLERIADGLEVPDDSRMQLGLAPRENFMKRRTALGLGLIGALSPSTLTNVLRESAAEALEFTRERAVSTVGSGTLQHLTAVVAELDRAYPWRPPTELFPIARAYRQRVESLINGRHTLAEARELYVHGAYLSHILSDLAWDLGSTLTAEAYAIDSYQLADQAGHDELCAWAADTLACVLRWTSRPGEAINAALKGLRRAPRQHPLAARMHARAAQAHADRSDRASCVESITQAWSMCEQLPDEMPSRLATDRAEHVSRSIASYAADCYVELGDWPETMRQARIAYEVSQWSPGRAAGAQLDMGIALANSGSPEEAVEHGMQALPPVKSIGSLMPQARKLATVLSNRYPNEPFALEFHEHYRQLASHPLAN